ncbi:hypothetical protein [Auraticoccus monumenti]|uniref:O-antigen ligase like membrane protein n=1 Tax=Auraticoccus monumenti TaxID=675864 RepID=A0A1G6VTG9_9ACTN|nr:hypothetical protein [Auraticoccus monumenti]SDD56858.1 hypothetical protein SAMN04489747_1252 [Auraticoccus monumenti]
MPSLSAELLSLGLLGLGLASVFLLVVRRSPRTGAVVWLLVVALVPIWVSVTVVVGWSSVSVVGMALVAGLLLSGHLPRHWNVGDLLFGALFVVSVAPAALGVMGISSLFGVLSIWVVGWLVGRLLGSTVGASWLSSAVAVVFAVVAVLALLEFVTGWHGLSEWGPSNSARAAWSRIQGRGGLERSEGAFGHSIALGCSLAMAMVLTLQARFRPAVRLILVVVMLAGAAVTMSRVSVLCSLLGLGLAVLFSRSAAVREVRRGLVVVLVVGGVVAALLAQSVYARAGAELEGSASYRGNLIPLLQQVQLLGPSPAMQRAADGTLYFGSFRSIDSQLILFGISYGGLTLLLVLALLAVGAVLVLTRRASLATIAVVAQVPALATVALITQYAHLTWFVAGLAIAMATEPAAPTLRADEDQQRASTRTRGVG